jgi:hypothetical protein
MAQIIKHRRGSLEALSNVTGSLQKGEIVIASGSTNLTASNGNAISFIVPQDGQVQATNRIIRGTNAPNVFPGSTYGGMLNGVPFYASSSTQLPTLFLLGQDGNEAINLVGNIQPFSASVATSINALSSSIGSGTIGNSVNALNTFSGAVLTQFATIATVTASYDGRFASLATISGSLISTASANTIAIANINSETASIEGRLATLATYTASLETTLQSKNSALATISGSLISTASANTIAISNLNSETASIEGRLATLATYTSSLETKNTALATITGSLISSASADRVAITNINLETASIEGRLATIATYTSSVDGKFSTLGSYTASLETKNSALATISGSLIASASAAAIADANQNLFTASFNTAFGLSGADVTVKGNLTVAGTTTTVNSTTVQLGDNIIELNGNGAANGGIYVKDATAPNTATGSLLWDSTNDYWKGGALGAESKLLVAGGDSVVSGSSQVQLKSTTGFTAFDLSLIHI